MTFILNHLNLRKKYSNVIFLPPDISQFPLENLLPGQVISATFTAVSCFQELFDAQFTTDSFLIEKVVAANRRVNWCL
jgi:hypothetical protein